MKPLKLLAIFILVFFLIPNLTIAKEVYRAGDKNQKIAAVQKALPSLGFKVDRSDGAFSKDTGKAVKKFQKKFKKKYKLKATGMLDDSTYQAIISEANGREKSVIPAVTGIRGAIVKTAAQYKGVPYKFGGMDNKGFDCSGYVQCVFGNYNIKLTRSADTQFKEGVFVLKKDLQPGDLVFFETYAKGASHVGIFAGSGKFWHASSSKGVMLSGLEESYWKTRYIGSRRIIK